MAEWQPIETAPRGDASKLEPGHLVDVLAKTWSPDTDKFTERRFINAQFVYCLDGFGFWKAEGLDGKWRVTHWAPVPAKL